MLGRKGKRELGDVAPSAEREIEESLYCWRELPNGNQ